MSVATGERGTYSPNHFNSMPNFRQVSTETDKEDKHGGKLFRSSRPDFLSSSEVETFRQLNIRSIIDFRSAKEYRKATGCKLLDFSFPVYKVKIPLFGKKFSAGDRVVYAPLKVKKQGGKTKYADNLGNLQASSNPEETNGLITPGQTYHGGTEGNNNFRQGKHFLIDFFKLNYVWAVYTRAPWYFRLYSLLFLVMDVILNTGYRYFVRVFARNVLNKSGLAGQYKDMICFSKAPIYAALKLLCDPDNLPAMLNCAHGKDRTGIVTAMILACLGKSKEYIAYDYGRSEVELEPIKGRLHDEIVKRFHMHESFTTAKADTMMQVINYVDHEYGSMTDYLNHIGFGPADQEQLRRNLLG